VTAKNVKSASRGLKTLEKKLLFQIQRFDDLPPDMLRDNDGFRPAS
jgi:hypothetical protein